MHHSRLSHAVYAHARCRRAASPRQFSLFSFLSRKTFFGISSDPSTHSHSSRMILSVVSKPSSGKCHKCLCCDRFAHSMHAWMPLRPAFSFSLLICTDRPSACIIFRPRESMNGHSFSIDPRLVLIPYHLVSTFSVPSVESILLASWPVISLAFWPIPRISQSPCTLVV